MNTWGMPTLRKITRKKRWMPTKKPAGLRPKAPPSEKNLKNSEKSSKLNKLFLAFFFFFILGGCAPLKLSYKPAPNALKALAKVETGGLKSKMTIILKSPDLMRIEFYGPLSGIAGVVAGNGKNCFLYSNGVKKSCNRDEEGSIYPPSQSPAPPLNPEELVPILLGMEADL